MALVTTSPEPRLGQRITTLTQVCDAAVTLLHSASLSIPFISTRSWLHVNKFEDMGMPVVDVSPGPEYAIERESRSQWRRTPAVSILVRQRIDDEAFDERLDALMGFVEEIREAFARTPLPWDCEQPQPLLPIVIISDPLVVAEHLEQLRQFTSGLLVTYSIID